jgi:hypothetical protein
LPVRDFRELIEKMEDNPHNVPHMINVIACDCYSHGISVEPGDIGEEAYLCTWYRWHSIKVLSLRSLYERLKFLWEILTNGNSSADCIVLTETSIDELITELQNTRIKVWGYKKRGDE